MIDAKADEAQAQSDYDTEIANLTSSEADLKEDKATYEEELATAQQNLEETNEDSTATTRERDAIEAFLAEIKPGCDFIADHYSDRAANRAAEKSALQGVIVTLQGTPAFQNA